MGALAVGYGKMEGLKGPLRVAVWQRKGSNWQAAEEIALEEGEWLTLTLPSGTVVNVLVNGEGVKFATDDGKWQLVLQ